MKIIVFRLKIPNVFPLDQIDKFSFLLGNGFAPLGTKPLPQPMLVKLSDYGVAG